MRNLKSENQELQMHCASAIFKVRTALSESLHVTSQALRACLNDSGMTFIPERNWFWNKVRSAFT